MAPICPVSAGVSDDTLFSSAILMQADFLACSADANELLDPAQLEVTPLSSTENYPILKVRQILAALRLRKCSLPVWLLSEYPHRQHAGDKRLVFRGRC